MKKTTFAALAALAAIATTTTPAHADLYPATMEIVNISGDVVTMETSTGHIFEMTGAEDYLTGDLVALIMDDAGTPQIFDDSIVSARYAGYWTENGRLYIYEE